MSLQNTLPTEGLHRLDVAITAVSYDALFVAELSQRLDRQLSVPATWHKAVDDLRPDADADAAVTALLTDTARVVVVLHQRLWGRDERTAADALALRDRVKAKRHKSILVVTLDGEPVPAWLKSAPSCAMNEVGVDAVVARIVAATTANGGDVGALPLPPIVDVPVAIPAWSETRSTFMAQPRALSALRHEFETLTSKLAECVKQETGRGETTAELHTAPQRLVVQMGTAALSMSWVAGRTGNLTDGRLMVIEWTGAVSHKRQMGGLQTAQATREQSYRPQANGPDDWCWRLEGTEGVAYSSKNLAGQCFSSAALALTA